MNNQGFGDQTNVLKEDDSLTVEDVLVNRLYDEKVKNAKLREELVWYKSRLKDCEDKLVGCLVTGSN